MGNAEYMGTRYSIVKRRIDCSNKMKQGFILTLFLVLFVSITIGQFPKKRPDPNAKKYKFNFPDPKKEVHYPIRDERMRGRRPPMMDPDAFRDRGMNFDMEYMEQMGMGHMEL